MKNEEDDTGLWNACLTGSRPAFERLYKRYFPLLYVYGMKLIADREQVQDTIQDLFIKLIQNKDQLSDIGNLKAYIYRAFRNRLLDALRQTKITQDIAEYEETFTVENLFDGFLNEDDVKEEQNRKMLTAYKQLPSRQQEVLYLFYVKELKHEEIAKILSINCQSSKNLLFRAVCKLRSICYPEDK